MVEKKDTYGIEDLKKDLVPIVKRIPAYSRLVSGLLKDPRISKKHKATLGAGLAYLASPIDFIPGAVPVLGQLDDLLAALFTLNAVLSAAPQHIIEPHLQDCGLTSEMVREDVSTVKRTIKDLSLTVARVAGRGLSRLGKALLKAAQKSIEPKG